MRIEYSIEYSLMLLILLLLFHFCFQTFLLDVHSLKWVETCNFVNIIVIDYKVGLSNQVWSCKFRVVIPLSSGRAPLTIVLAKLTGHSGCEHFLQFHIVRFPGINPAKYCVRIYGSLLKSREQKQAVLIRCPSWDDVANIPRHLPFAEVLPRCCFVVDFILSNGL